MALVIKSMSSELTGREGSVECVVADSASEDSEVLPPRSEEDDDAVDGSRVVPGVARVGDVVSNVPLSPRIGSSEDAEAGALPSLT